MVALTVPSPFPRHNRHEERQQEEDDGVQRCAMARLLQGVTHAVVEELHPRLGPEEFRGDVQRPIRETEDEAREDIYVRPDADVVVGEFRQQDEYSDEVGERENGGVRG